MRRMVTALVILTAVLLPGMLTGCTGEGGTQKGETVNIERSVPEVDTIPHERMETATFAMG